MELTGLWDLRRFVLLPSGFPIKIVYTFLISPVSTRLHSAPIMLVIVVIFEKYTLLKCSLCIYVQPLVSSPQVRTFSSALFAL